jgi:hypothetical protein
LILSNLKALAKVQKNIRLMIDELGQILYKNRQEN